MRRHIVFSSVVCLSVCPSRFRVRSISFEPWWDLQIFLHKCQVWWDDVQCLCLTKVGSRSRSQSKIKHCMTVFRVHSISFEPLVGFTNNFAQMSSMMIRCAVCIFDQVGSWSRSKFKAKLIVIKFLVQSLSLEPLLGFGEKLLKLHPFLW